MNDNSNTPDTNIQSFAFAADANATKPNTEPKKPEEVIQITAKVDLTKKPESAKETINLLNDDQLDEGVTQNTEGDVKKKEAEKAKTNINDFRQQNSQSTGGGEKPFNPTIAKQQAEAWVKIVDMAVKFGLKAYSGQADNTGLDVPQGDKDVLAEQLSIAMTEYKFVAPILLTILTTLAAMYATPVMNARESKKKIDEFRAMEKSKAKEKDFSNIKIKPTLDPSTGLHKKKKGGQYKA